MGINDVLEALKENFGDIPCLKGGFVSLPKAHTFATWHITRRKADGADGYNLYWEVSYELRIFYRDNKTAQDCKCEREFEDALRECEELESSYEYDDDAKLNVTVYSFTDIIDF